MNIIGGILEMNNIFKRQNDQDMLEVLYAQRYYYNKANKLEYMNLVIMLIICIVNFFEIKSTLIQIIVNLVFVLISILITQLVNNNILKGADLKKYLDYTLFNFEVEENFQKNCLGLVHDVITKKKKNYETQINNDGKANPPGLKDWYFNENKTNNVDIIKSLQRQNLYWDSIISKIYLTMLFIIFALLLFLYIIIAHMNDYGVLEIVAGIIPFGDILVYLIIKVKSYILIDKNMGIVTYMLDKASNEEDLIEVQKKIDTRRHINFSPPNIIHKIISKTQHEKYEYENKK